MSTKDDKLELRYVPLDEAVLFDRNAKKHDYGAIIESIRKYGFKDPPKIEKYLNGTNGTASPGVVEGNGRITCLRDMHMNGEPRPRGILGDDKQWLVPILFGVDAETKELALGYALDHNALTLLGGDLGMYDIAKIYDEKVYADILRDLEHAGELVDRAEELQKKWQVAQGDIWQIGEHFLICGDCTNFDDWQKLLNAADVKKVNGVFTSPPYAEQRKKQYGGIPTEKYVEWWYDVQANVRAHLADDGSFFVNIKPHCENGERVLYVFDLALAMQRKWKWRFVDELCWTHQGMPGVYGDRLKNQFEPVYHFATAKCKTNFDSIKYKSDRVPRESMGSNSDMQGIPGDHITKRDIGLALPGNVLFAHSVDSVAQAASFPIALVEFFIKAYSDKGDAWLDPFIGSGTTICAAHRNGRCGLGIEKLEKYVAVCLERIAKETGEEPKRIS